jgi:hypothetical protein
MVKKIKEEKESELSKEIAPLQKEVSKIVLVASELKVANKDDLQEATNLLAKIKMIGRDILSAKEQITKPLNETLRNVRGFFAPVESQWSEAEVIVKKKMLDFQRAELAKAKTEEVKIEAKVEAGKMSFDKAAEKIEEVTPEKTIKAEGGNGSAQFKKIRVVKVEDEKLIPDEYWVLDMVKVRKVALAGVEIPGVKVVEELSVAGSTMA